MMLTEAARAPAMRDEISEVVVLDPTEGCPASQAGAEQIVADFKDAGAIKDLSERADVITYEIESGDSDVLESVECNAKVEPSPRTLRVIQDKYLQKSFLAENGIPVPDFVEIRDVQGLADALDKFGYPALLKARRDAYDGRGNYRIRSPDEIETAYAGFEGRTMMLERFVPFEMEVSVMEVVEELEEGERALSDGEIDAINNAFIYSFLEPIPFKVDKQDKSDEIIHMIRTEQAYHYDLELSVRNEFARNPIPPGTDGTEIVKEIKARLEAGGVIDEGHDEVKYAMIFNLPLAAGDAELVKATGPILSGDGFKIIPPRTLFAESRDFSYDAFAEPLIIEHGADGSLAALCLIECVYELDDGRIVHQLGDNEPVAVPTTVNTAHLGFILRMEEKGYVDAETGETTGTVGHIFPIFRALASDVNLPLALALWSFLAVQYFGMRGVGIGANFGKYIGVGSHAIVKGPMGVFVGVLEIVSEVGRVISFTFRLFGNIFAGEVVLFISMFLVAFVVPTVFFGLEVFVGFIQAFVFAMLTLVFASTAVGDHDEHHDEAAEH